jgi:hypothetical protein
MRVVRRGKCEGGWLREWLAFRLIFTSMVRARTLSCLPHALVMASELMTGNLHPWIPSGALRPLDMPEYFLVFSARFSKAKLR